MTSLTSLEPTGLAGLAAAVTGTRFFMWHTDAPPHFWVKYEGPEGSLGSQQIVRELLRFETKLTTEAVPTHTSASLMTSAR